jgi:uncharacterized protein YciI
MAQQGQLVLMASRARPAILAARDHPDHLDHLDHLDHRERLVTPGQLVATARRASLAAPDRPVQVLQVQLVAAAQVQLVQLVQLD